MYRSILVLTLIIILIFSIVGLVAWKYFGRQERREEAKVEETEAPAGAEEKEEITGLEIKSEKEAREVLQKVVNEYLEIQEGVGSALEKRSELDKGHKSEIESFSLKAKIVLTTHSLQEEKEIIAQAVSTFLEIGRSKDILQAKEINAQDIEYIKLAQKKLAEIIQRTESAKKEVGKEQELKDFINQLINFYKKAEEFFEELLKYKHFNGKLISVVKPEEVMALANQELDIKERLVSPPSGIDQTQFLTEILEEWKENYADTIWLCKEIIKNIQNNPPPINIKDFRLLQNIHKLLIEKYNRLAEAYSQDLEEMNARGLDIFFGGYPENTAFLEEIQAKIEEAYFSLRSDSELAEMFNDLIKRDKEIQQQIIILSGKYDLSLAKGKDLEILLDNYKRTEESAFGKKLEELQEKINEFNASKGEKGKVIKTTYIEPTVYRVEFFLDSPDGLESVIFRLKSPSGRIIDEYIASNTPGMDFVGHGAESGQDLTYIQYRIENPEPGMWQVLLEAPVGLEYFINIGSYGGESKLLTRFINPRDPGSWYIYRPGEKIVIEAEVYDSQPILGLEVTGIMEKWWWVDEVNAEKEKIPFTLNDSGFGDDRKADDGIYTGTFVDTNDELTYCAIIRVEGKNNKGEMFNKQDEKCVEVTTGQKKFYPEE